MRALDVQTANSGPAWLQKIIATMGGGGAFIVAFLDSSVLSFPFITDALVIHLSLANPQRMRYYAAMATLGSLCGCIWIYLLAKKGGEVFFRRHVGGKAEKIKHLVKRHAFLSICVAAILPPPFPFKPFVLAEGVFQCSLRTFVLAILFARGLRYAAEGILAVRYGEVTLRFIMAHGVAFAISALGILALLYIATRLTFRYLSPG